MSIKTKFSREDFLKLSGRLSEIEARLAESEAEKNELSKKLVLFQAFSENHQDLFLKTNSTGICEYASPSFCNCFNLKAEELLGKSYSIVIPIDDVDLRTRAKESLFNPPYQFYIEKRMKTRAGWSWIAWTCRSLLDQSGEVTGIMVTGRDISDQKSATQEMIESKEKYKAIVEAFDGYIYICSQNYLIEYMNKRFIERTGKNPIGEYCFKALHHLDSICPWCVNDRVFKGETVRWEVNSPLDNRWFYVINSPIRHSDGSFSKQAMIIDITERKLAETELFKSKARLQAIVDNTPILFFGIDRNGIFTLSEGKGLAALGLKPGEMVGKSGFEIFPNFPSLPDSIRQAMQGEAFYSTSEVGNRVFEVWYSPAQDQGGKFSGIIGIATDITERKRSEGEQTKLQSMILQMKKLEGLGALAGGIAHDFNNLLTAIMGNIDLGILNLPPENESKKSLEAAKKASQQAANLCRQMLAYSGKSHFVVKPLNLNEEIFEMIKILEISIPKNITLKCDLSHDLPLIEADEVQIRQVIMNLVINASEAITTNIGIISISTKTELCQKQFFQDIWYNFTHPDGMYVCLEISDTGCGMSKETIEKIFDPFYTTKFTGRGLGLPAVLGIVHGHKGAIKIESKLGKGTTFQVYFPPSTEIPQPSERSIPNHSNWQGQGTILFVDDEAVLRELGEKLLRRAGFKVITAADGKEAIFKFSESMGEIVCVILDLIMPNVDGEEAFKKLRNLKPDIRVLISTGFCEQEVIKRFEGEGLVDFLQKPYQYSNIVEKLEEILKM
ncbi:MAG: PAS domain S-box protein [Candidatus Riflebacteria bacterium]|nr:PAS domain S-box protein [Candidatus Riflebacteria bacterium]